MLGRLVVEGQRKACKQELGREGLFRIRFVGEGKDFG